MEGTDDNRELLENVTISDVNGSQYMIQRMSVDNAHLLNGDLLSHHGNLVVDIGGADFIPVNYTSEDLQQLTEEDRNLAAALVAVQFSQQQKHQQQHQQIHQDSNAVLDNTIQTLVTTDSSLDDTKVISKQELMLSEKNELNDGYLQIVGTNNIYDGYESQEPSADIKCDEVETEFKDSDGENRIDTRSSRKSLPHKKRISRKLNKKSSNTKKFLSKCTVCEQSFSSLDEYMQHQELCRTTITPIFSCQICQDTFYNQLDFFEHLKSHYEPVSQLNVDDIVETEKKEFKSEENSPKDTSLLSSLLNLHCMQCNKVFRRQKAYEAHVRDVHENNVELNEFSDTEDFINGIDVVVDENDNDSNESEEEETKSWSKYRDDELQATEEDLKELEAQDHVCHICKEPFPIRAILLQHLTECRASNEEVETVSSSPKKKPKKKSADLSCVICGRVFTHRNSLVYHMRSHTGDRPHQCECCGKSFFAASALKVHKRLHSGDKPYKCDDCGRHFRQWGDLKYHTISLHSDTKQYQCEYCGKDFARKYSLIVHRRIHTGEKNYKCEFCGKTFRASSYLQNHRRIHTGEKPHTCEVCGKPFRVRSDMKRHMKTHVRRRLVIAKLEDNVEQPESILPDSEEGTTETQIEKIEPVDEQVIAYEQDPLENVRESNSLYSQGQQFFVLYADTPVRSNEGSNSSWIQSS